MAVPLGIALVWLGYSIGYYGWNRITGGNDTFISLVYPGRYSATTRDSGAGGPAPAAAPGSQSPAKAPAQQGTNPSGPGYSAAGGGTGAVHP